MKTMQMREAKAKLSEVVEGVVNGEPVTITRHGTPLVMVVSIADGQKLYPDDKPKKSLIDLLTEFPGPLEIEKDRTPPREIDL